MRVKRVGMGLMFLCALMLCCITALTQGRGQEADKKDTQTARTVYLEMVRMNRLPYAAQAKQITTLYRDMEEMLAPLAERRRHYAFPARVGEQRKAEVETPEEFAERQAAKNAWIPLLETALDLRLTLLEKHLPEVTALVREDLRSSDSVRQLRGLLTTRAIRMPALFEEVVALYRQPSNPRITQEATPTLRFMNDPRTRDRILPLLQTPPYPENYFSLLQDFSANRPAPAPLLHCLDSEDPHLRHAALTTLGRSGDPKLAPYIVKFLKAEAAEMRQAAAWAGLNLTGEAAKQVRPEILKLLQDPDQTTRLNLAWALADRKDPVAGPSLLALLKDETLDQAQHSNVVQAMNTLAGSYFGYAFGDWKPTTPNNRAAIAKFAEWIAAHPAPKE